MDGEISPGVPHSKTGYRGVYETSWGGTWFATVQHEGRSKYLGTFPTKEAAARAYDQAAVSLHGSAARLNFPEGSDHGGGGPDHEDDPRPEDVP